MDPCILIDHGYHLKTVIAKSSKVESLDQNLSIIQSFA